MGTVDCARVALTWRKRVHGPGSGGGKPPVNGPREARNWIVPAAGVSPAITLNGRLVPDSNTSPRPRRTTTTPVGSANEASAGPSGGNGAVNGRFPPNPKPTPTPAAPL